jgi:hypothetical protein
MIFRPELKRINVQAAAKLGLGFSILPGFILLILMYATHIGLKHEPNPQVYYLGFRSLFAGMIGSIFAICISAFVEFIPSRPSGRSLFVQSLVHAIFWIASFKFFWAISIWLGLKQVNFQALALGRGMLIIAVIALCYSFLFSVVLRWLRPYHQSGAA